MRIKKFLMISFLHSFFFIIGTIFFILFFRSNLLNDINIIFYRGIILLTASCILVFLIMIVFKKSHWGPLFTYKDVILSIILIACVNLVFFTHFPVTVERSISVFLLNYMNKHRNEVLTDKEITEVFINKYLYEFNAIDKRLQEQLASGNIICDVKGCRISKQGELLIKLFFLIADIFKIDKKIVSPNFL